VRSQEYRTGGYMACVYDSNLFSVFVWSERMKLWNKISPSLSVITLYFSPFLVIVRGMQRIDNPSIVDVSVLTVVFPFLQECLGKLCTVGVASKVFGALVQVIGKHHDFVKYPRGPSSNEIAEV
jgi:hypothetical protein